MLETNDANFIKDISSGVCLVDFWAEWCGPCRAMLPKMEELSNKIGNKAKIFKINVDDNTFTTANFKIMSIPTLILFKDGEKIEQFTGMHDIVFLESKINEILKK